LKTVEEVSIILQSAVLVMIVLFLALKLGKTPCFGGYLYGNAEKNTNLYLVHFGSQIEA
jgi:hypothetical protein